MYLWWGINLQDDSDFFSRPQKCVQHFSWGPFPSNPPKQRVAALDNHMPAQWAGVVSVLLTKVCFLIFKHLLSKLQKPGWWDALVTDTKSFEAPLRTCFKNICPSLWSWWQDFHWYFFLLSSGFLTMSQLKPAQKTRCMMVVQRAIHSTLKSPDNTHTCTRTCTHTHTHTRTHMRNTSPTSFPCNASF
jgi:hypothetical protein